MAKQETGKSSDSTPTVDAFLVALQKTLSRVSRDSANVPAEQARSLIVGNVAFDVALKCELVPESLHLTLRTDGGGFPLNLSGQIATDVAMEIPEDSPPQDQPDAKPKKSHQKKSKSKLRKKPRKR